LGRRGVRRRILLDETTHADEIAKTPKPGEEREGWIQRGNGEMLLRRVPYLARLRNLVLEPLEEMAKEEGGGERFERVVWVGDVVFGVCTTDPLIHMFVSSQLMFFFLRLIPDPRCPAPARHQRRRLRGRVFARFL
jgi:hypothetical protein